MKKMLLSLLLLGGYCLTYAQQSPALPPPHATKSYMKFSNVKGWEDGEKPVAPDGFMVNLYAADLQNPRWLYELPNGDVLVAESNTNYKLTKKIGAAFVGATKSNSMKKSADRITLLRDADHDGVPETRTIFLQGLNQPFGMLLVGDQFYVANTDGLLRFKYIPDATSITTPGEKIASFPAGKVNQHWTRNIIANKDNTKFYVAVGCGTDHGEKGMDKEQLRANILEMNPDGSGMRVYASGLRNPVGMGWAPGSNRLWTVVNERDKLGNDLVPDYLTSVKEGGFYGWPYSYFGQHPDPRVPNAPAGLIESAIVPDFSLKAHTASLGLAFYTGKYFPDKYQNGAFITQHGSWNRKPVSGYKVVFVPFKNGRPSGPEEDFLTGFVKDSVSGKVRGRPVGITLSNTGALLVTDDKTNRIWRISYGAPKPEK
jgi:glucose/arabinose dehydrogenase